MGIFNIFAKKAETETIKSPYMVRTEWVPYRLHANTNSMCSLMISVKNMTKEPLLTSVAVDLPKNLKFDKTGMVTRNESKLGMLEPDMQKDVRFDVYSDVNADQGTYAVNVTAYAHYEDYAHVMNSATKTAPINVIKQ